VGIFSKKDDEKPRADFSNVQGGSSTSAPTASQQPAPFRSEPATPPTQTHVVASGDSLSKIAKQYYGDANQWRRIYEANRDQISNPDLIKPGQNLKIPGK
jgi:nucleoid-associated protein YgaU